MSSVRDALAMKTFVWITEQLDALPQQQRIEVLKAMAVRYEADLRKMADRPQPAKSPTR